jgi:hypothetical protein
VWINLKRPNHKYLSCQLVGRHLMFPVTTTCFIPWVEFVFPSENWPVINSTIKSQGNWVNEDSRTREDLLKSIWSTYFGTTTRRYCVACRTVFLYKISAVEKLGYFAFWLITGGKLHWPIIKLLISASRFWQKKNTFLNFKIYRQWHLLLHRHIHHCPYKQIIHFFRVVYFTTLSASDIVQSRIWLLDDQVNTIRQTWRSLSGSLSIQASLFLIPRPLMGI